MPGQAWLRGRAASRMPSRCSATRPLLTYERSGRVARGCFGHVFNDQLDRGLPALRHIGRRKRKASIPRTRDRLPSAGPLPVRADRTGFMPQRPGSRLTAPRITHAKA